MCDGLGQPASVTGALAMLDRALDYLNAADAASLPSSVQAETLRALERAGAKHIVPGRWPRSPVRPPTRTTATAAPAPG